MKLVLDPQWVRSAPVARNPTALGVLAHLSAFVGGSYDDHEATPHLCVTVSPAALADTLTVTKAQVTNAIVALAKYGAIGLDKGKGKRGEWEINLTPIAEYLEDCPATMVPVEVPTRALMDHWGHAYKDKVGYGYPRTDGDFFREKKMWVQMYQEHGEDLYKAIDLYFEDQRYVQWCYNFKVFFKAAGRLLNQQTQTGWDFK
jgi:hypothetical protein